MDPEQARHWREADELFATWLDLEPAERDPWLARQPLSAFVREALLALIAHHRSTPDSMPGLDYIALDAGVDPAPRNGLAGRRIGDWELVEEIGRGGMSVVYRARRLGVDFEQLAAVKLLGLAALAAEGHARFDQERRLLARLRHPHIAPLIDGGIAADGTPFLVMPLIEGETLARHCELRRLDWRQRVRLMVQVCDAVAHAHHHLMVHRDLKPSNIMVTAEDVPILLDFGIAKLLDDDQHVTRAGTRALTPGYAAPEQREDAPVTTAADVYALGIVLGELCAPCGTLPSDLRNIIAMATRAEPDRRYPDARALGEDLERLLAQRAVRATPDSTAYRLRAFLRRRRGLVLAVGAVTVALCVGLGMALWQAERAVREATEARRQAARAEAARDFLFSMVDAGDRERHEAQDPPVSTLIARGGERLRAQPLGDPELHAEMATLLGHLETSVGQHARAAELLDSALESAIRVDDASLIAGVRLRQGILANATGEPATAIERFEQALALLERVPPARRPALRQDALAGLAYALSNTGRAAEAQAMLQEHLRTPAAQDPPFRAELLLALATVTPDPTDRLAALGEVAEIFGSHPATPANQLNLNAEMAGTLIRLQRPDEAVAYAREAAALADRIHPGNTSRRARSYNNLGSILSQSGRMGEADTALAVAEDIYRALGDDDSAAFAALLHNRGVLLRDIGAAERAVPLIEQASALARSGFGADDVRSLIALRNLAYARAEADDDGAAIDEWRACAALGEPPRPWDARLDHQLIGLHVALQAHRLEQAAALWRRAQDIAAEPAAEPSAAQRTRMLTLQAELHAQQGDARAAEAGFAAAESLAERSGQAGWSARWRNAVAWSRYLQRLERREEAGVQARAALALLEARAPGVVSALRTELAGIAATE